MKKSYFPLVVSLYWMLFLLNLLTKCVQAVAVNCPSQKPPQCWLPPTADHNATNVYNQLQQSVIKATSSMTVYSGQNSTFEFVVDKSVISDIRPIVYINGCASDGLCSQSKDEQNKVATATCTFADVNQTNDDTEIELYTYSEQLGNAQLCHDPPSILTVIGKIYYHRQCNVYYDWPHSIMAHHTLLECVVFPFNRFSFISCVSQPFC